MQTFELRQSSKFVNYMAQVISIICIAVCIIAIYFSLKVFADSPTMEKKNEKERPLRL
jgi:hypothetical protein